VRYGSLKTAENAQNFLLHLIYYTNIYNICITCVCVHGHVLYICIIGVDENTCNLCTYYIHIYVTIWNIYNYNNIL